MAETPGLRIEVKLDYTPVLAQLRLPEIVAQMRYEEYQRGREDSGGGRASDWDRLSEHSRQAWRATALEALQEAMG